VGQNEVLIDTQQLDTGYRPFIVEGDEVGELSELPGAEDVRAGVYRVKEGEYPDRVPIPYVFETDEYIWVIEGEVHVVTSDGSELTIRAGDSAFFRAGSESTWTFFGPFRKFSVEVGGVFP
jgi:uncharacterized cupin superfamily protein